jgi:hypothetical protein
LTISVDSGATLDGQRDESCVVATGVVGTSLNDPPDEICLVGRDQG